MTVGGRQYNEGEMLQMQRDAEARVLEMQQRSRRTLEGEAQAPQQNPPQQQNRNWNSNPGTTRRMRWPGPPGYQPFGGQPQQRQNTRREEPAPQPAPESNPEPRREAEPPREEPTAPAPDPPKKSDGTIVGDIMDALGLDEDYLLIIGLLLILINQRADTTLILALAYLLI